MFATVLIGFREGLEAALIVGVLIAYVNRIGRRDVLPRLWAGVAAAVILSLCVGAVLTWGPYRLSDRGQEIVGGIASLVTVALVTWMILWMATNARSLVRGLQSTLGAAIGSSGFAVAAIGFVSVAREGIETALLLWSTAASDRNAASGVLAALGGIVLAVGTAWLINRGLVRFDLARFFRWTAVLLVIVAAGILVYGIHEFQEAHVLPGDGAVAIDLSAAVPPGSWYGAVLAGIVNFTPQPTWLQLTAWVLYVGTVLPALLLRTRRTSPPPRRDGVQAGAAESSS